MRLRLRGVRAGAERQQHGSATRQVLHPGEEENEEAYGHEQDEHADPQHPLADFHLPRNGVVVAVVTRGFEGIRVTGVELLDVLRLKPLPRRLRVRLACLAPVPPVAEHGWNHSGGTGRAWAPSAAGPETETGEQQVESRAELIGVVVLGELMDDVVHEREGLGVELEPLIGEPGQVLVAADRALDDLLRWLLAQIGGDADDEAQNCRDGMEALSLG